MRKPYIILAILTALILGEVGVLLGPKISASLINIKSKNTKSASALESYADQVIARCAEENYRPPCYDKEIPKLMDFLTLEDAFKVTAVVQEKDPVYAFCHVLGHELSAREVKKDPTRWKDIVSRCPSGLCSNGCLHGGFQEKFRDEKFTYEELREVTNELTDLCEPRKNWQPTPMEQASCYHALGHLTMYITSADIPKAIEICEKILNVNNKLDSHGPLCYDGVFMQLFQPLEPEDFALIKGKEVTRKDHASFCNKFTGRKKAICWVEGWPLLGEEIIRPEGVVKHCSGVEKEYEPRCYHALFYILTVQLNFDLTRIKDFCAALPDSKRDLCFADAASRFIETDYRNVRKAVELCNAAIPFNKGGYCFRELLKYATYNFHPGSEAFFHYCNGLPSPWNERCRKQKTL